MRHNPVKDKLRSGQPVFGTWLSTGDLLAARVLARMRFDWLTLDLEHAPLIGPEPQRCLAQSPTQAAFPWHACPKAIII